MAEEVSDDFHRHAAIQEMLRGGMPKCMWASPPCHDADARKAVADDLAQCLAIQGTDWRAGGEEDSTPVTCWPPMLEVVQNRLPNFLR